MSETGISLAIRRRGEKPAVSAILLAAGESKRMGQPKQLMPLDQTTILGKTLKNLLNSMVSEIIVVLGYKAEEVIKTITDKPVKIVVNPNYQQGMSTSIIAGLKLIDSRAQAFMLALGDQPYINSQTINSLIEAFGTNDKGIVIPVYQGRRGHPVVFAIRYQGKLLKLKGDVGGREIVDQRSDDVLEVAVNCEGIHIDIDTLDNYTWRKVNPNK